VARLDHQIRAGSRKVVTSLATAARAAASSTTGVLTRRQASRSAYRAVTGSHRAAGSRGLAAQENSPTVAVPELVHVGMSPLPRAGCDGKDDDGDEKNGNHIMHGNLPCWQAVQVINYFQPMAFRIASICLVGQMDLFLRKVIPPQATDHRRLVVKDAASYACCQSWRSR
jgi:hypothetical protein